MNEFLEVGIRNLLRRAEEARRRGARMSTLLVDFECEEMRGAADMLQGWRQWKEFIRGGFGWRLVFRLSHI